MKITTFEEIQAWQAARKLTNLVYDATKRKSFDSDRELRRQMRRAAVSSMSNIAEGFDAGSDREFRRFLRMAQRSTTELRSHLYVVLDQKFLDSMEVAEVQAKAQDTWRLIGGFVKYLANGSSRHVV